MDLLYVCSNNFEKSEIEASTGGLVICSVLRKAGFDVGIVDFDYLISTHALELCNDLNSDIELMVDYIIKQNPKVISFYTMCNHYPFTVLLAKAIKAKMMNVKIIFAGPQASLTANETIRMYGFIDVVAIGEGESYIADLVSALLNNDILDRIPNICFRKEGAIIQTETCQVLANLDESVEIDYSLFDVKYYDKCMGLDVGRGCPYGCSFCSTTLFWKKKFRMKSNAHIINEVKHLSETYGIEKFGFNHDLFTLKKESVIQFCNELINSGLKIKWACSARIDSLDEEMIKVMKESGCSGIFLGIETGSPRMQKIINKNLRIDQINHIIELLNKYKIDNTVSFIYGFDEEQEEDLKDTLRMLLQFYRKGSKKVMLHKMAVMPMTQEFNKLSSRLYFDETESSATMNNIKYKNEMKKIIGENKELYSVFYEFDNELRKEYRHLNQFISMLCSMREVFGRTIEIILEQHKDELLNFYKDFSYLLSQMTVELYDARFYSNKEDKDIYFKYFTMFVKENYVISGSDLLLKEIFEVEEEIYDFIRQDVIKEKYITCNINLFKLRNNIIRNEESLREVTTLHLSKLSNDKIHVQRVV